MTRLYAELVCLFHRFSERHSDPNPIRSAGAVVVAIQQIVVIDIVLLLDWAGWLHFDFSKSNAFVVALTALLVLVNFMLLRDGRAAELLAMVRSSSLTRAKWTLAAIGCITIFTLELHRRAFSGS